MQPQLIADALSTIHPPPPPTPPPSTNEPDNNIPSQHAAIEISNSNAHEAVGSANNDSIDPMEVDSILSNHEKVLIDENFNTRFDFLCSESSCDSSSEDSSESHSSNCDNESNNSNPENDDEVDVIKRKLANFVINHRISSLAADELLPILRSHTCLSRLPRSRRKLVNTPREKIVLQKMLPGNYFHFGIIWGIERALLETYIPELEVEDIKIFINMDGLDLSRSSKSQFWPILCYISSLPGSKVYTAGIFQGNKKPLSSNEYLKEFVDEVNEIVASGYEFKGRILPVRIEGLICDTPAKSYVTNTLGHAGFESCYKCVIVGQSVNGTTCFPELECVLRTDEGFRAQSQKRHHHGHSELERLLHFDMITNVPYDTLHLSHIGVAKKKLQYLFRASYVRLSTLIIQEVSDKILTLVPFIPSEFARKPRGIEFLEKFKGTEYRQIILYTAPIILLPMLQDPKNKDNYIHVLTLQVALRILTGQPTRDMINYSRQLLHHFVGSFEKLHSKSSMSHNVHALLHIPDDVAKFGSLEAFSAYRFEDNLGKIRRMLKDCGRSLQQYVKRELEYRATVKPQKAKSPDWIQFKTSHFDGPLLPTCFNPQHKQLKTTSYSLTIKQPNNCLVMKTGEIVLIENFATSDSLKCLVIGRKFESVQSLYTEPCESSIVGMWKVKKLGELRVWHLSEICSKCMYLPLNDNYNAAIKLLHLQF
jgi:hypothetical protein